MKVAIVVPTIREENIAKFLHEWKDEFTNHIVIVVEDNPEPSFDLAGHNIRHYSWHDIDTQLGQDAWIIPRKTDCIRSYGFLKAHEETVDMVVSLDDDCYPKTPQFLECHHTQLSTTGQSPAWTSTIQGLSPRGYPYYGLLRQYECVLNHGLWDNIPDLDAITQLARPRHDQSLGFVDQTIPKGTFFPMCGMNIAFKKKLLPAMYFLLMGQIHWPFDRYGDIWCGLFVKRICDHLGLCVKSGEPHIFHERASNAWVNLQKELPGYEVNEVLWKDIDSIILTKDNVKECYSELAEKLARSGDYWAALKRAMIIWSNLFD